MIRIDDLDFSLISRTPNIPYISHTCCPPIFPVSIHVPNFTEIPPCLCIFSTLLGATWCSLSVAHTRIGHYFLFGVADLSRGLSLEQMVGFSLVHSLLSFPGCKSWGGGGLTNTWSFILVYSYYTSTVIGWGCAYSYAVVGKS